MPTLNFVTTLSAGQEEACRRMAQQLMGSQRPALTAAGTRLGLRHYGLWLAHTPAGAVVLLHLAGREPQQALARLSASDGDFDQWFVDQWLRLTGEPLAHSARRGRLERLFEWNAAARAGAEQNIQPFDRVTTKEMTK